MSGYSDGWWQSGDGLRLHYRDYAARAGGGAGAENRPPIVCLPGLTRNARDFAALAEHLSAEWRVLCPEMRGRGLSDYAADPLTYTPRHYLDDVLALLDGLGVTRFVAIGTSLGGLMTLALALQCPERIAGAVLNDIGPSVDSAGLRHIFTYLGLDQHYRDWNEAAGALRATFAAAYPDRDAAGWEAFARRLMTSAEDGSLRHDYDPRIVVAFGQPPAPMPGLWPGLDVLAQGPLLVVRGALSDILSADTLAKMRRHAPAADIVELPRIGHPPELDEPASLAGIARLLARVA